MTENPNPATLLRDAAERLREVAQAATPGTWKEMHLGSEGCIVINDGKLRDRKRVAMCGWKEWQADHADAVYVASMQPAVALALADWLEATAKQADEFVMLDNPDCVHAEPPCDCDVSHRWACGRCGEFMFGGGCTCWDGALAVARAILAVPR